MSSFTRLQLYEEIENTKPSSPEKFLKEFVLNKLGLLECSAVEKDLFNRIHCFLNKLAQKIEIAQKFY